MGFFEPSPPPFELEEWKSKPHLTRLKPLVQDWGMNGFGSPTFVYFIYVLKLILFSVGALFVISLTPGLGTPRQPHRLVDGADRLPEARGLAAALGDPRPGRGLDAAQLPLRAADRRGALLAATRAPSGCRPGRSGFPSPRGPPGRSSTSPSTRACSPPASSCSPPPASTRPRARRASCRRPASRCCSRSSGCSGCATRSRSSGPARRSTSRSWPSGSFRSTSGSSPGSSSSSSSGGARRPRS